MTESANKSSVKHFLRIPGVGDDRADSTLLVDGKASSVAELVSHLPLCDASFRLRVITILEQVSSPSRSDVHTIATALYSLSCDPTHPEAGRSEEALNNFLIANSTHTEAISIGAQLLRTRGVHSDPVRAEHNQRLVAALMTLSLIHI